MFRTPDHYGFFIVNACPIKGFSITTNGKVTGSMLVQHYAGYIYGPFTPRSYFVELNLKI